MTGAVRVTADEETRRLVYADGILTMFGVGPADASQRAVCEAVAAGDLSADDGVRFTLGRHGLRLAAPSSWRPTTYDGYLNEGSTVLRNRLIDDEHPFGILDAGLFQRLDVELSRIRLIELAASPVAGPLDYAHFQSIHRRLMGDLYDWAGEERVGPPHPLTITTPTPAQASTEPGAPDVARPPTMTHTYYAGPDIANAVSVQFAQLSALARAVDLDRFERLDRMSESGGELQMIRPFRDGNGRTHVAYAMQYFERVGLSLSPATYLNDAGLRTQMIQASLAYLATGSHAALTEALERAVGPAAVRNTGEGDVK